MNEWFQLMMFDESLSDPFLTDSEFIGGLEPWELAEATEIRSWSNQYWLRCSDPKRDGRLTDALQNHLALPIYSAKLQEEMGASGISGFQFLPIRILRSDNAEIKQYAIANILNMAEALDLSRSDYDVFDSSYFQSNRRGQICAVRHPVLLQSRLKGFDVFRLREFPDSVFVSSHFRDSFESKGFRGHQFRQVAVTP